MGKWKSLSALLGIALFLAWVAVSCGGAESGVNLRAVSTDDASALTNELTEMLDPAGLTELYGISSDLYQGVQLSPSAVPSSQNPDSGKVLVYLNPNKIRRRGQLLRWVEAPLYAAWFFGGLMRAGDSSCFEEVTGWDTCPLQIFSTGECRVSYTTTTTGCSRFIYAPHMTFTVTLTGDLDVTVKRVEAGFEVTVSTSRLKVEGPDGKFLSYNGSVTKSIEFDSDGEGHTSTLTTSSLTVVDSAGAVGTVSGKRIVEVRYGKSLTTTNSGVLTYTPPDGENPINIEVNIRREVNITDTGKRVHIWDQVITDGVERTRTLDVEIEREENEGGILKSITVSGDATFSGPKGELEIRLQNLVIDVNCPHNPSGGKIIIKGKNHTIEVTFRQDCSCHMEVTVDGGEPQDVDACSWNEFKENAGGGGGTQ